jgi:hypothetical protein
MSSAISREAWVKLGASMIAPRYRARNRIEAPVVVHAGYFGDEERENKKLSAAAISTALTQNAQKAD